MRIVFWGSERNCCATSNMLILANYLVSHKGYRITMLELAEEKRGIWTYFPKKNEKYVENYIRTLIEHKLYYVPMELWTKEEAERLIKQKKKEKERKKQTRHSRKKTRKILPEQVELIKHLESNMDMVFINLANRTDKEARDLMKNAHLVVINLQQDFRSFDVFYSKYANLSARMFFLIGNYFEKGGCDKEYLCKKYDIDKECLTVIPNNPEYQMACAKAQVDRYMRRKRKCFMTVMKRQFLKEVEEAAELLYQNIYKG